MPKISALPIIILEKISLSEIGRTPEDDLIMDNEDQVRAFTESGTKGSLVAVYLYNLEQASKTLSKCKKVLDLGCGSGAFLSKMALLNPNVEFIGLDLSEPMLKFANIRKNELKLTNLNFIKQDFTDLSQFADESIDGFMSMQALHHLPTFEHLEKTYKEIHRCLTKNGAVYIQDLIRPRRVSTIKHLAYYDDQTPMLTQIDGEKSFHAAFKHADFLNLSKLYLPSNLRCFKTFLVDFYLIQKTPSYEISEYTNKTLNELKSQMDPKIRKIYKDLRLIHSLGGLR